MLLLYAVTVFFSAALLFAVQPMFARMALPLLGGSPSVWNTALVFYQATLLAGYLYADVSIRHLGVRRQVALHVALLVAPIAVLPIRVAPGWAPPPGVDPTLSLLALFAVAIGLPFFAVSTTAPLLQRWFAKAGHPSAADPYFLYATSNAGSFLALLSYPLIIEPVMPLSVQTRWWAIGYGIFVTLVGACVLGMLRTADVVRVAGSVVDSALADRPSLARRARWLALALIPSSLMLGVTTYISSDLAAVPLLWIAPLSAYLLSFVLAFARRPAPHRWFLRLLPIEACGVVFVLAVKAIHPVMLVIPLHLLLLFTASMVCHGELARDRPPPARLTEFYLWVAVGGVVGGIFNTLLAPLLFQSVVEYPLMIVASLLIAPLAGLRERAPTEPAPKIARALDVALPIAVGLLTMALVIGMEGTTLTQRTQYVVALGAPALIAFGFSRRPVRFGLAVGAILFVGTTFGHSGGHVIHSERTFFGVHRVALDARESSRQLLHGGTLHGVQSLDPARRRDPLGYYSRSGPAGDIFRSLTRRPARVAVVGLGNGTLAAYALPGETWTFFEIDAAVERIGRDPRWFTYLADSPGAVRIVLGDGRLSLAAATDRYDLLILDAYSSEAIPLHLLSREALALYRARLTPGGMLAFHISNRHFDLAPVVARLARDARMDYRIRSHDVRDPNEISRGVWPSTWAVLTVDPVALGALTTDPRWHAVALGAGAVWSDAYSSPLTALR